ncbi:hypothetical protein [Pseudonocardia lacus]|uniref:hypothetical protein n=1 Tax=Pseudonocardia lacus TaxID=2835865 RepID=UPI001BDD6281|nr:hypothetical protein [Pseudonocardia lacus]
MTLLAVGVLGGALFVANTVGSQESPAAENTAASSNTSATAPEAAPPEAAPPAAPEGAAPPAGREVDLSGVEVAGAGEDAADDPTDDGADDADAPPAEDEADAPAEAEDEPKSTFAGESRDGALTVAIAVNGNDAAAVVTDGETEFALDGTATANGLSLQDRTGKVTMNGDNPGDGFTGTVTLNGQRVRYTAELTGTAGRPDVADAAERVGL